MDKNTKKIRRLKPDQLFKKYGAIVTKLMSTKKVPSNWWNDIYQDAYVALIHAQKTYDGRAEFTTWCWHKVNKAISDSTYKYCYPYGMSTSFYYTKIRDGAEIHSVELDENTNTVDKKSDLLIHNDRLQQMFCERINKKFDENTCNLIIDYYIHGLRYSELLKKYGNVTKMIRKIDLSDIFKEIKKEYEI